MDNCTGTDEIGIEKRRTTLMQICREQVWNTLAASDSTRVDADWYTGGAWEDEPGLSCPERLPWCYEVWLGVLERWLLDISSPRWDCARSRVSMMQHWNAPLDFLNAIGLEESWVRKMALKGDIPMHPVEAVRAPVVRSAEQKVHDVLKAGVATLRTLRDATGLRMTPCKGVLARMEARGTIVPTRARSCGRGWRLTYKTFPKSTGVAA